MGVEKKVSIKTISEMAGVSTATVSRVINNVDIVSSDTKKKVEDAISKSGFVLNAMARGLRTNSLPLIGILVPDIINEYFSRIVLNLQLEFSRQGYSVFICNTDESQTQESRYLNTLTSMMISGLICISGYDNPTRQWPDVPTVYIDRNPAVRRKPSTIIESDNISGGYLATLEMLRQGCENVAILVDERDFSTSKNRIKGYSKAIQEANKKVDNSLIFKVKKVDYENAFNVISEKISSGKNFDALFCTTDWLAVGAINALKEKNIMVPQQVKVVGYDDISISKYFYIPITTIHQDIDAMCKLAVTELMRMINGEKCTSDNWIVPVSLVKRNTTQTGEIL